MIPEHNACSCVPIMRGATYNVPNNAQVLQTAQREATRDALLLAIQDMFCKTAPVNPDNAQVLQTAQREATRDALLLAMLGTPSKMAPAN